MELECSNGLMEATTQVNGLMMSFKDVENIHGVMVESLKVNGWRTSFMVKVYLHGLMVEATEATMKTMLKVALESTNGQMARNLKDNGKTVTKMEKEFSLTLKVSQERVFGKMEKE